MVSEDPQDLGRFPVIHRLRDLRDLNDPWHREVPAETHQLDDLCELVEVVALRGSQWVLHEERNDHAAEVTESLHAIPEHVFPVVVVPAVPVDLATSEESNHLFEDITARGALRDGEFGSNLPPQRHLAVRVDGTAETALAIDETHDPSDRRESFLLVFRTLHIVTAVHHSTLYRAADTASSEGCSGFSSI